MRVVTFGAPGRYVQGPGVLDRLGELTVGLGRRLLVVGDADVLAILGDRLQAAAAPEQALCVLPMQGEVTPAAIAALTAQGREFAADLVAGLGGGKALDAAKGVAKLLNLGFVSVPTVASNDSPTARAMAIYDESHTLTAIDSLQESPRLVLADTALIARAPMRFLVAGIGDAVAKKFEAERAAADGSGNFFDGHATLTSLAIADACYRTLRAHGVAALQAAREQRTSEALEAVVEANILMAGLAYENVGLSYAHAIVRGLVKARGAADAIHGLQVAYATLVQLALEGREDPFIADLMGFYGEVELPVRLAELGMPDPTGAEIAEIARLTGMGPAGGRIQVLKSAGEIAGAIKRVEALAAQVAR